MKNEKPRILIIDDDAILRSALKDYFTDAGYATFCTNDARKGPEIIRKESISAVITDIMMPGQEGVTTVRAIKREFPHITVLAMTGSDRFEKYLKTAEAFGADKTFCKPVHPDVILDTIEQLTKQKAAGNRP